MEEIDSFVKLKCCKFKGEYDFLVHPNLSKNGSEIMCLVAKHLMEDCGEHREDWKVVVDVVAMN